MLLLSEEKQAEKVEFDVPLRQTGVFIDDLPQAPLPALPAPPGYVYVSDKNGDRMLFAQYVPEESRGCHPCR